MNHVRYINLISHKNSDIRPRTKNNNKSGFMISEMDWNKAIVTDFVHYIIPLINLTQKS